MRWSQLGFGRTSSTSRAQETPRNLMGFKDGTNNIKLEDGGALRRACLGAANSTSRAWMRGGTYLVTRRIRMLIEVWDRATPRRSGADDRPPQGQRRAARPGATSSTRSTSPRTPRRPVIPSTRTSASPRPRRTTAIAHPAPRLLVHRRDRRRARPARRRPVLHQLPARPGRRSSRSSGGSAATDALNEYIKHTGSALFACPPGVRPGGYVGETLLG